jgi:NAD(P)-dependent dehydrogenase (short-subunit alcohol dehydrogenase family)
MNPLLLVTGGSRGIGAATALRAAARGWDVAINYTRDEAAAQAVAGQVQAMGRCALVLQADVADEAAVLAMFARIDAEAGRLGGLVNNAGVVDVAARIDGGSAIAATRAVLLKI